MVYFLNDKGPKLFISLLGKSVRNTCDHLTLTTKVLSLATVALIIIVVSLTIMHTEYVKWSKIPITRLPTVPTVSSSYIEATDFRIRTNLDNGRICEDAA